MNYKPIQTTDLTKYLRYIFSRIIPDEFQHEADFQIVH